MHGEQEEVKTQECLFCTSDIYIFKLSSGWWKEKKKKAYLVSFEQNEVDWHTFAG